MVAPLARPLPGQPARRETPAPGVRTDATRLLQAAGERKDWSAREQDRIAQLLRGQPADTTHAVDLAAEQAVGDALIALLTHGWAPRDVRVFAARRLDARDLDYLTDALAATRLRAPRVPWTAQLDELRADVWWSTSSPHLRQWSRRRATPRSTALQSAGHVLALLTSMPRTDLPLLALPGGSGVTAPGRRRDADGARIDALLARARATTFPAEAQACAAKAAQLRARLVEPAVDRPPPVRDATWTVVRAVDVAAGWLRRLTPRL